jgi:hypothetical protein
LSGWVEDVLYNTGRLYAALPAASDVPGGIAYITDSTTNTLGAIAAGSGTSGVLVWSNGTNWIVIGYGAGITVGTTPITGGSAGNVLYTDGTLLQASGVIATGAGALSGITTLAASGAITDTQSIGVTSTDGLVLQNTTAATVSAQQWSPRLRLTGQGWSTTNSASQAVDWIIENETASGAATPLSTLTFKVRANAGSYAAAMQLTSLAGGLIGTITYFGRLSTTSTLEINNSVLQGLGSAGSSYLSIQDVLGSLYFALTPFNANGGFQLGPTDAAAAIAQTIQVQSVSAGHANTAAANWTFRGSLSNGSGASGNIIFNVGGTGAASGSQNTALTALTIYGATATTGNPSIVLGNAALATNATDGFLYISSGAGTPTGTPTTQNGGAAIPMYIDTTNSQLWLYMGGAWKQPKTPAGAAIVTWQ